MFAVLIVLVVFVVVYVIVVLAQRVVLAQLVVLVVLAGLVLRLFLATTSCTQDTGFAQCTRPTFCCVFVCLSSLGLG